MRNRPAALRLLEDWVGLLLDPSRQTAIVSGARAGDERARDCIGVAVAAAAASAAAAPEAPLACLQATCPRPLCVP